MSGNWRVVHIDEGGHREVLEDDIEEEDRRLRELYWKNRNGGDGTIRLERRRGKP